MGSTTTPQPEEIPATDPTEAAMADPSTAQTEINLATSLIDETGDATNDELTEDDPAEEIDPATERP